MVFMFKCNCVCILSQVCSVMVFYLIDFIHLFLLSILYVCVYVHMYVRNVLKAVISII